MISALKIELKKLLPYKTFWILTGLYFVLSCLILSSLQKLVGNVSINGSEVDLNSFITLYSFPNVWNNIIYTASWFKIFLAIIIIIITCNEFAFNTIRQNVFNGMSRAQFVISKYWTVLLFSVATTLLVGIIILIKGESSSVGMFERSTFLLAYFIQVFGYLSAALFTAILIRKTGFAIIIFLLYTFPIEPLLVLAIPDPYDTYMPFYLMNDLIQNPFGEVLGVEVQEKLEWARVGLAAFYAGLFTALSFFVVAKRDL